ncbi:MAG: hypothetical protein ABJL72_02700 [Roseobacter sp.]
MNDRFISGSVANFGFMGDGGFIWAHLSCELDEMRDTGQPCLAELNDVKVWM